ncbi:MAG: TOBE domain-containing protein [Sulfurimonas sp.]|nr:TOBE domain-containing protein [Sulfurimonas sp.]
MSTLKAKIVNIQNIDNLHIVKFDFYGEHLSMMSLELNDNIQIGVNVLLKTKATSIAIAKKFSGELSYSNKLNSKILSIQNGKLLTTIKLQTIGAILESIITKDSSLRMNLEVGDDVVALIKANEISIVEIIS